MAEEITRLITEITRSSALGGAASNGRVQRPRAVAGIGLVGRRVIWALALSMCALAIGASLMLTRTEMSTPHRRVVVRQPILPPPPVPAVSRNEGSSPMRHGTTYRSSMAPIARSSLRQKLPHPARRGRAARMRLRHGNMIVASRPRSEPVHSRSRKALLGDRPSPHLTGMALERALAEDAVTTRRLNLEQLNRTLRPGADTRARH